MWMYDRVGLGWKFCLRKGGGFLRGTGGNQALRGTEGNQVVDGYQR